LEYREQLRFNAHPCRDIPLPHPANPYDAATLARIDRALEELFDALGPLESLEPHQKRRVFKMGPGTEGFCRDALMLLEQNPDFVPPALEVARARAQLETFDQLRPRLQQLSRLQALVADTMTALGVEVASVARDGYKIMRRGGGVAGMERLRAHLQARYRRTPVRPRKPRI
jgi:hypothetical protein